MTGVTDTTETGNRPDAKEQLNNDVPCYKCLQVRETYHARKGNNILENSSVSIEVRYLLHPFAFSLYHAGGRLPGAQVGSPFWDCSAVVEEMRSSEYRSKLMLFGCTALRSHLAYRMDVRFTKISTTTTKINKWDILEKYTLHIS